MHAWSSERCCLLAVALLVTAGCGGGTTVDSTRSAAPPSTTRPQPGTAGKTASSRDIGTFNRIANSTEAVVIATVGPSTPMQWNSEDGEEWSGVSGPELSVRAYDYREVTITVDEVLRTTESFAPAVGDQLVLTLFNPPPGPDANPGKLDPDEWSGRLEEGKQALLMLMHALHQFEGGREERPLAIYGTHGAWTIEEREGARFAVNVEAEWSGPLDALLRSFDEERKHGRTTGRGVAPDFSTS